jgi:hypothetical protein
MYEQLDAPLALPLVAAGASAHHGHGRRGQAEVGDAAAAPHGDLDWR